MNRTLHIVLVLLALGAGCGAPTSLDLCHAGCEVQGRCKSATTAESQSCHARCESLRATYAAVDTDQDGRCKNTPAVRRQLLGCLSAECNQVEPCTAQTDVSCAQ